MKAHYSVINRVKETTLQHVEAAVEGSKDWGCSTADKLCEVSRLTLIPFLLEELTSEQWFQACQKHIESMGNDDE